MTLPRRILLLSLCALLVLVSPACLPPHPPPTPPASLTPPPTSPTATTTATLPVSETPSPAPTELSPPQFTYRFGRLTIVTTLLKMEIKDGAIVLLRDQASGETLLESDPSGQCDLDFLLSGGFTSRDRAGNLVRACPPSFQKTDFQQIDDYRVRLLYQGLNDAPDTRLTLDLAVDPATGEVLLQLTGQETRPGQTPAALNLALMNLKPQSMLLGSGVEVRRADPPLETQTTEAGYGLYGVTMAVLQGEQAAAAMWSESTQFAPEFIRLIHDPARDHLILHSEPDPKETVTGRIVSPPWRIGTYARWEQAARRWRQEFERRTGARPLWEHRAAWVRRVHAVFDATNQLYEDTPQKYAELAAVAPPECVLFYLWNGDRLVLFGDPTLAAGIGRPDPGLLRNIQAYGWPLLLYHPFNLIYTENGAKERLASLAAQGWLPPGYQFTPDFPGAPEAWYAYWQNARGDYDDTLAILHPAAPEFQGYLVQNFGNYASRYGAKAAYLDVLGNDGIGFFAPERRLIAGQDYVFGEIGALTRLQTTLPDLAVMSEYQAPWLVPYVFYTWEGVETHLRQAEIASMRLNHPLRAALLASYQWTRETNGEQADDLLAALLGTLPQISLVGDYEVSDSRAVWSQQRAALFCQEELFHDLPDRWDADALAYYRSQRTGHWFKLARMGTTYGYVEILPDGTERIRLKR
ncbi:MAG: hypothetical protein N2117_14320 [Anaerolineales bacterium]|nr:hypothetical protein [Anaerolineales bacterium]